MKSCWTDASASFEIPGGGANPSGNGKFTFRPIYHLCGVIVRCNIAIVNPKTRLIWSSKTGAVKCRPTTPASPSVLSGDRVDTKKTAAADPWP
jgi:hypothetical protein